MVLGGTPRPDGRDGARTSLQAERKAEAELGQGCLPGSEAAEIEIVGIWVKL